MFFTSLSTQAQSSSVDTIRLIQIRLLKLLALGTLIVVPILWISEAQLIRFVHPIDQIGYPALLISFGTALLLLSWRKTTYLPAALLSVGTFALYEWLYLQIFIYGHTTLPSYTVNTVIQWFPLVYVLFFLFFDRAIALKLSLLFYGSFAVPILVFCLNDWSSFRQNELLPIYLQIAGCHPFYITSLTCIGIVQQALAQAKVELGSAQAIAELDFLTGIGNRRASTAALHEAITNDGQQGNPTAIALVDIDYFKNINDTFGHDVGDEVLTELVQHLQTQIRDADIIGRWGGEEFILILPATNLEQAQRLSERLCQAIAAHSFSTVGQVTISMGVSCVQSEDTLATLLKRADTALYAAKQSGRNRVSVDCLSPVERL